MAPPRYWKGYLKLSLVTCPVAMIPASSEGEKLRFHTLNRATGNRVASRYVNEKGKALDDDQVVKGYPTGPDSHVMLEDEELASVALESTRTIDIESFVPADDISWLWYETPHYLVPDDKIGEEAFAVIREAMAEAGMAGISRLVLHRRERAVLLKPIERGILLWTLRPAEELRDLDDYLDRRTEAEPDAKALAMVTKLIEKRHLAWSPDLVEDPVQDRLRELIEARRKRRKRPAPKREKTPEPEGNVINIMDALKRSLSEEKRPKR